MNMEAIKQAMNDIKPFRIDKVFAVDTGEALNEWNMSLLKLRAEYSKWSRRVLKPLNIEAVFVLAAFAGRVVELLDEKFDMQDRIQGEYRSQAQFAYNEAGAPEAGIAEARHLRGLSRMYYRRSIDCVLSHRESEILSELKPASNEGGRRKLS